MLKFVSAGRTTLATLFLLVVISSTSAQPLNPTLFNSMKWRCIGPHRGGRTVGAVGVPQEPNVFYIGVNNGGVWKTTDYGRTWFPIFDDQPTGSIGDVVVAPSNPNVLYVGSGEGLQRPDLSVGDGMYKSTDAGKSWAHLGLNDVQQIGGLAIDPTNENKVFVAALGHPYGANEERGVYRTQDGGRTWEKVLYKDENTGAVQVTIDPQNPNIIYADMWAGRQGPWENGAWNGPESGLFKSTNGGTTWTKLIKGLPTPQQGLGRIGFCIAPSDPKRLYATVDAGSMGGIYKSDDAGESWRRIQTDARLWGRGSDFAEMKVDPKNADIVYSANVVTWKSTDGGMSWNAFRGAPGGDDYHRIWINPLHSEIILIASDQGAIITVNGGETFSSWYNQPTAQFYHVSTDNAFPYNVYGGQQESGSVGIASRGNDGQINFRDWHPVGVEEYGYVAADPLNPNIIYGGKITKYDKRSGQVQNIAPETVRSGKYRFVRTAPVLFSPLEKSTLFFAGNVLFKTTTGGKSWEVISPDLSRDSFDIPGSLGIYATEELKKMPRRGVIYAVAPSYVNASVIWAGTDDGLIHLTKDGGRSWKNVTPSSVTSWSKVSIIEASHFDANTAYAAVNRIRCDDMKPHIYKTNNAGKSWTEITNGLPDDPINTVREDPRRKGLLFAGSERAVFVSFDDGANWQSLRLNMPATSIRDLVIKDDDIVVGTHGRSFWILDNMSSLRQLNRQTEQSASILYKPPIAYRVRWNQNPDTPIPQEEPAGDNPPDGAIIDYFLKDSVNEIRLEILDAKGKLIRSFSNSDKPYSIPPNNVPSYWIRPQQNLSASSGSHRFVWDLHYAPLDIPPTFPIAATYHNTAPDPTSPWVMPGTYTVRLLVAGKSYSQPLQVKMDPRVNVTISDLQLQHDISLRAYNLRNRVMKIMDTLQRYKSAIQFQTANSSASLQNMAKDTERELLALESSPPGGINESFGRINAELISIFNTLQDTDMPATSQLSAASVEAFEGFEKVMRRWADFKKVQLKSLNEQLKANGQPLLK
jgi:photosystem II stability/assembly factor-like uncharacterized protein